MTDDVLVLWNVGSRGGPRGPGPPPRNLTTKGPSPKMIKISPKKWVLSTHTPKFFAARFARRFFFVFYTSFRGNFTKFDLEKWKFCKFYLNFLSCSRILSPLREIWLDSPLLGDPLLSGGGGGGVGWKGVSPRPPPPQEWILDPRLNKTRDYLPILIDSIATFIASETITDTDLETIRLKSEKGRRGKDCYETACLFFNKLFGKRTIFIILKGVSPRKISLKLVIVLGNPNCNKNFSLGLIHIERSG